MIIINSHSKRSRIITYIKDKYDYNIWTRLQLGCKGAYTAGQFAFAECAYCLQSLFQQNKSNVSFREMARLIDRNSLSNLLVHIHQSKSRDSLLIHSVASILKVFSQFTVYMTL